MSKKEITLKGLDGHEDHLVYDAADGQMSGSLEDCARSLFPAEGETTPRLRFQGFEGEWEKAKLGDLFTERVENDINGEMLSVTMNQGIIKASENGRFDNSNSDKSHYKVVKVNDIAYNSMRMWQGASGCSPYDGIVSPAYTVVTPIDGIDPHFFACLFKTSSVIKLFRLSSQGLTTDTWNLKYPAFSKIVVSYPQDINEQKAIASFFHRLDAQIALRKNQYERLQQMKAACLESMFPRESQITPPIRFSGYDNEWETVVLKDICEINPSSLLPEQFDYVDLESVVGTTMISHRKVHKASAPSRAQRLAKDGDIFYQTVRPYQKNNYLFQDMGTPFVFSTGYAQLRTRFNSAFIFTALQTDTFVNQVLDNCTGTSYPAINSTSLSKLTLKITKNVDEQKSIASFFKDIDSQITTIQQRLDKLKQMKSACLRSMFPQSNEITPPIRFIGFEEAWESNIIANMCKIATGKSNTQDQVEDGKYPFYIRSENVMRSNKYLYDCEAVITIGDGKIGQVFHYVNGKFDLHQRCYKMTDFKGIDGLYFYYYFSSFFYERAIKMSAKATVDSVRMDMIADMTIKYPTDIKEQKRIASFFHSLDSKISLQTQRIEKLKQLKTACLSRMIA